MPTDAVGVPAAQSSATGPPGRASWRRTLPAVVGLLFSLAGVLLLVPVRVRSDSMSPTLLPGDDVLVERVSYWVREPRRADLVIARDPRGGGLVVKRVAAVATDTVGIEDGVLVVNGRAVREPDADLSEMDSVYFGPVTVPDGHVFLLGDNRTGSEDSRDFGTVPVGDVSGQVLLRIWPPRSRQSR